MNTKEKKIIIAIDGYSSSGKSTMARTLARRIGYTYIDSGAMYRAVTLYAMRHGWVTPGEPVDSVALIAALPQIDVTFAQAGADGVSHTLLNGQDVERRIREMDVAECVSPIAVIPQVRQYLVKQQQQLGLKKGIVMDGRDIGTTVFPHAEMKIFVDASPETRAHRRLKELQHKGDDATYDEVLANIQERDYIDRTRKESPLRQADDAIRLDNDNMSLEQQELWLIDIYKKKIVQLSQV